MKYLCQHNVSIYFVIFIGLYCSEYSNIFQTKPKCFGSNMHASHEQISQKNKIAIRIGIAMLHLYTTSSHDKTVKGRGRGRGQTLQI